MHAKRQPVHLLTVKNCAGQPARFAWFAIGARTVAHRSAGGSCGSRFKVSVVGLGMHP